MSDFFGFPREALKFLTDLERNNNRAWFQENKQAYKEFLEEPAKAFLEAMAENLESLAEQKMAGKIFRIYRDVRFSKDKTPYNSHLRMAFARDENAKPNCSDYPMFYFSLEPEQLILGTGIHEFSKDTLTRYRETVSTAADGKKLATILSKLETKGLRTNKPELKRIPHAYDKQHPHEELIRRKGLTVWDELSVPKQLHGKAAVNYCIKRYKTMLPIYHWLKDLH